MNLNTSTSQGVRGGGFLQLLLKSGRNHKWGLMPTYRYKISPSASHMDYRARE
jgi:hypothetical protein